jgi:hypothetical protein
MITAKDHSSGLLFDLWSHIGPKRRKMLDRSWAGVFRNFLLHELPVERIAGHFTPYSGRPSKELYAMVGVLILQQMHDLSDEDTQRALAFNLDWQYALDITDDSDAGTYVSERTLRNYRRMILEDNLAPVLFESLTDQLIAAFGVDVSKQRLDSTHIQSNMRKLGRARLFAATIRKFLRTLKRVQAAVFSERIPPELAERYLSKSSDSCFSRVKPSESVRTLEQVSGDLLFLVESFRAHETIPALPEYKLMERMLREQCTVTGSGTVAKAVVKPSREVSPDSLQNPSDPDAGYSAYKGRGYQAQIMETYRDSERDPGVPNLITHVAVEPAHQQDVDALHPALDATAERNCGPEQVLCDTLYGSDRNVVNAGAKGVTVIAPTGGERPVANITLAQFSPDLRTGFITRCPAGHAPLTMRETKKHRFVATFSLKTCKACPRQQDCPVRREKKAAFLRYDRLNLRCACRRAMENTPEFREAYRWRAGIEGTNSHLKSDTGAGRLRVRGLGSVRLAVTLKALGLNIFRCARALAAHAARFLLPITPSQEAFLPRNPFRGFPIALFHRGFSYLRFSA